MAYKPIMLLLVLLVGSGLAQAQPQGVTVYLDVNTIDEGTHIVFENGSVRFHIDYETHQVSDDTRVPTFTNPTVSTASSGGLEIGIYVYTLTATLNTLDCPNGYEAVYAADENEQYHIGYCQAGSEGRRGLFDTRSDASVPFPFWISYPGAGQQ